MTVRDSLKKVRSDMAKLEQRVAVLEAGEPAPVPDPTPTTEPNTADVVMWWAGSAMDTMDVADLRYWRSEGVDGWVPKSFADGHGGYLTGFGGNQRFTGDPSAVNDGAEWAAQRMARDTLAPNAVAAGQTWLPVLNAKNHYSERHAPRTFSTLGRGHSAQEDADWTNITVPRIREFAAMVKLYGGKGFMFDNENYPASDGSTDYVWGGGQGVPGRRQWYDYGAELGSALGADWPDIHLCAYFNTLPGSWDDLSRYPTEYPPAGRSGSQSSTNNFWVFVRGLTKGLLDAAPNGDWNFVFHELAYYRGRGGDAVTVGHRQVDLNGPCAFFSRYWPHWGQVHDRIGVEPFIWLDRGEVSDPMRPSETPFHPDDFAAQHQTMRDMHMVVRGDLRARQVFMFNNTDLAERTLAAPPHAWPADYQPALIDSSTPAVQPHTTAPVLVITTPAEGATIGAATAAVAGTATPEQSHGITAVTWANLTTGAKGHVPMDWVRSGGSAETSWVHVTTSPVSPVPVNLPDATIAAPRLAMGVNVLVFTARDTGGLTSSVTRNLIRTPDPGVIVEGNG